ncbi:MAG: hypothetical protein ACLQNV_11850 [Steroidobacteraceae bacterium]|jgi:hypothetical protein
MPKGRNSSRSMKRFTVLGLIICLIGCTTLQPATGNPAILQKRIASGELLKPGDNADILTKDGRRHVFKVKSVSASTIDGQYEFDSVPIDQVDIILKRKLNVGKTALAVGLGVVIVAAVVVVAVGSGGRHGGWSGGHASRGPAHYTQPPPPPSLQILQTPPQTPQLQTCAGPGSENKTQEEGGRDRAPPCPAAEL